jgi:hypothetical protein
MIHHYFHQYIPKSKEEDSKHITLRHLAMFADYVDSEHVFENVEATPGFEMPTLAALQSDLSKYPDNDLILYAHTKGISKEGNERIFGDAWRESMQDIMLRGLQAGINPSTAWGGFLLEANKWEHFPIFEKHDFLNGKLEKHDFFGGNFWLAKVGFLKTLPKVDLSKNRFFAERWIGLTRAKLESPNPNDWPSFAAFYRATKIKI